jgi:hypothetical protein
MKAWSAGLLALEVDDEAARIGVVGIETSATITKLESRVALRDLRVCITS